MNVTALPTESCLGAKGVLMTLKRRGLFEILGCKAKDGSRFLCKNSSNVICKFLKELKDRIEKESTLSPVHGPREYLWNTRHKQCVAYESHFKFMKHELGRR